MLGTEETLNILHLRKEARKGGNRRRKGKGGEGRGEKHPASYAACHRHSFLATTVLSLLLFCTQTTQPLSVVFPGFVLSSPAIPSLVISPITL